MKDERNRRRHEHDLPRHERGFDRDHDRYAHSSDSERMRAEWQREDLGRDYGRRGYPGEVGAPMYARRYAEAHGPGGDPYGRDVYPGDVGGGRFPEDRGQRDPYGRDMYPGNAAREGYGRYTGETYGATGEYGQRFGEHRGHGPRDYTRPDARIHEDVCDHLSEDGYVDAREVSVAVSEGEVTLSGTVPERAHKRRAEDLAEGISGVRNVQNNLRVADRGDGTADARRMPTGR